MGNIHVKLSLIWTSDSGDFVLKIFLFLALVAILFDGAEPYLQLWEQSCEIILNLDQWFRRTRTDHNGLQLW